MMGAWPLVQRRREPEWMDDPTIDPGLHAAALDGLARINVISRAAATLWTPVRSYANDAVGKPLRLLDVACGGGDVTVGLWHHARRDRVAAEVAGCDVSDTAIAHARQRAARYGAEVRFFRCDVLREPLPEGFDVIVCSLFLHHLDEPEVVALLRKMAASAELVVISDLARSVWGLVLTHVGTRLLTRSKVVHVDGPRSMRAAWSARELRALAQQAGLTGAEITRQPACRMRLVWRRPSP